jgi:hypothetical protein
MKNVLLAVAGLAVFALYVYFWGGFLLAILQHPYQAFKIIVLPSLAFCAAICIAAGIMKARAHNRTLQDPRQTAEILRKAMQHKTTAELIPIVFDADRSKWTDTALDAAKETLKPRLFTVEGIDELARYRTAKS